MLEQAVVKLSRVRDERGEGRGLAVALASGVAVSMPVARFFLALLHDNPEVPNLLYHHPVDRWAALPFAGIACTCTTAGTLFALRAPTACRATLWVLASNVVPPAIVCAPTVYGLCFSVPCGFAAFVAVLPFMLLARRALRAQRPGQSEHLRLIGAALALLGAAALVGAELAGSTPEQVPSMLEWAPAIFAATTSLGLAGSAFLVDVTRAFVAFRIARGDLPGCRLAGDHDGSARVERVATLGEGPLRTVVVVEALGALPRSPARIALGALESAAALALLATTARAVLA